jgi:hypothetical protein
MSIWTTKTLDRGREYIVIKHTLRGVNYVVNGIRFRESYAVVEKGSKTYAMLKKIPVLRQAEEFPLSHLRKLKFITRIADIKQVYGQDVYVKFLEAEKQQKEADSLLKELELSAKEDAERERRESELVEKEKIESEIKKLKEQEDAPVLEKLAEPIETVEDLPMEEVVPVEVVASVDSAELVKELEEKLPEISKCSFRVASGDLCKFDAVDYSPGNYCKMHLLEDTKLSELGIEVPSFMTGKEKKRQRKTITNKLIALKKEGKI